jgi:HEPN domain-containing protein
MTRSAKIAEAERLLGHMRRAFEQGAQNISRTEIDRARFKSDLDSHPWRLFVMRADYSYFVARTLLSQGIHLYGLFCAHQCVEVYLKALLRQANFAIPQTHKLGGLLLEVRKLQSPAGTFTQEEYVETVCLRYEPFYEMARYPAQMSRPEEGKYVWASGVDEQILDYFVHRMRESLVIPSGDWDILSKQGHYDLELVRNMHPQFYALFESGNMNFEA